jgi:fumarylacetoacetase
VIDADLFGAQNLPYGSAIWPDGRRHVVVRVGSSALSLTTATAVLAPHLAQLFADGSLDPLLAAGRPTWTEVREVVTAWLADGAAQQYVAALADLRLVLAFTVADYVDFYASEQHATNVGRLFRPGDEPLKPNWKHLPVGYHGRAGTVVVSGTEVHRPSGQTRGADGTVAFGPSQRLDIEAEVAFVVGTGSRLGEPVPVADFADHVFGACLLNDWSARDIQAWEYVPLGPFLGKSFATSVSAWITPLDALVAARVAPPPRDPPLLPYLDDTAHPWALDIAIEVRLNGQLISRPPFAGMYWTPAQMLAHLTVNGASLRPGDLFASGTVSGGGADERGSLLEITWGGAEPLTLDDGTTRTFLQDGDEVVLSATAPAPAGGRIGLGQVRGRVGSA